MSEEIEEILNNLKPSRMSVPYYSKVKMRETKSRLLDAVVKRLEGLKKKRSKTKSVASFYEVEQFDKKESKRKVFNAAIDEAITSMRELFK